MNQDIDILVVDDSPTQALYLKLLLEQEGYKVEVAGDGKEAFDRLEEKFFPIVITDFVMPVMNGIELCQAIRKQEYQGYVYVIFQTAQDEEDDIISGLKSGADDYLVKPVNGPELVARLSAAKRIIELEQSLRKKNEEVELLSVTDPLTNTYNRRYMNNYLPTELSRSTRYMRPLSVIICDIDYFKKINDKYGHQFGDCVLTEFVLKLKQIIREEVDWVVRYGGEEFLLVLPETDMEGACKAAERCREAIAKMVVIEGSQSVNITASFGVACFPPTEKDEKVSVESLIKAADECLYQAKEEGRNRVVGKALEYTLS